MGRGYLGRRARSAVLQTLIMGTPSAWTETDHAAFVRRRPPVASLHRLVDIIEPGGRVIRSRRLKGGITTATHRVDMTGACGTTRSVVIRRFPHRAPWYEPELLSLEALTLHELVATPVPAPEVILVDTDASVLDVPGIVLSLLPGRGRAPSTGVKFIRGLAAAMAQVHEQVSVRESPSWIPVWRGDGPPKAIEHPLMQSVWSAVKAQAERLDDVPRVLTHHDFHPGNTLWYGRSLSGIVDWGSASWGAALEDLGYCRLDLSLQLGLEVADRLAEAYAVETGADLRALPAWDLVAVLRAVGSTPSWLEAYHDLGLTHLTIETVDANLEAFTARALAAV